MSRLTITDNHDFVNIKAPSDKHYYHDEIDENVIGDLRQIANEKIGDLSVKGGSRLLIFPKELNYYGDDIDEGHIISLKDETIATGNIMGFVGVNNTQIDIISRFAKSSNEDYFLHYMLQKVFSINLFDIKHTISHQQIFDFLLYLFPYYIKKALSQGLFKKYRRFEHNDANVKGPIDVSRHICENIPFKGTVAYSTREHSYDNEVTELIRHTIEYIKTKKIGSAILNNDKETRDCIMQVVMATPTYDIHHRQKIINKNIKPIHHPYYTEYTALQKICLQILRHETIKYGQEKDKVYGVLFDGAWLWEEYLNTIFKEDRLTITHAKNKTGEHGISLYEGGRKAYYPDFYRKGPGDADGSNSFVLDAKYKRLGRGVRMDEFTVKDTPNRISISRDDLFQMITYMHVLPAKRCALLYPIEKDKNCSDHVVKSEPRKLFGYNGEIFGMGIPISDANNYMDFCKRQSEIAKGLTEKIREWINS